MGSCGSFMGGEVRGVVSVASPVSLSSNGCALGAKGVHVRGPSGGRTSNSEDVVSPARTELEGLGCSTSVCLRVTLGRRKRSGPLRRMCVNRLPIVLGSSVYRLGNLDSRRLVTGRRSPRSLNKCFVMGNSRETIIAVRRVTPGGVVLRHVNRIRRERTGTIIASVGDNFETEVALRCGGPHGGGTFLEVSFPCLPKRVPLMMLLETLNLSASRRVVATVSSSGGFRVVVTSSVRISTRRLRGFVSRSVVGRKDESRMERRLRSTTVGCVNGEMTGGVPGSCHCGHTGSMVGHCLLPRVNVRRREYCSGTVCLTRVARVLLRIVRRGESPRSGSRCAGGELEMSNSLVRSLFEITFAGLAESVDCRLREDLSHNGRLSVGRTIHDSILARGVGRTVTAKG